MAIKSITFPKSSNITGAELDTETGVLSVTFKGAKQYSYEGFDEKLLDDWKAAKSAGGWFYHNVKTNPERFPLRSLSGEAVDESEGVAPSSSAKLVSLVDPGGDVVDVVPMKPGPIVEVTTPSDEEQSKLEAAEDALVNAAHTVGEVRGSPGPIPDVGRLRTEREAAFTERNAVLAALARMAVKLGWVVGLADHDPADDAWDPEWRTILFVEFPTGQASWHLHDRDVPLFAGLARYDGAWDGHTTEEKYLRLRRLGNV